jgi:hypothetical protein
VINPNRSASNSLPSGIHAEFKRRGNSKSLDCIWQDNSSAFVSMLLRTAGLTTEGKMTFLSSIRFSLRILRKHWKLTSIGVFSLAIAMAGGTVGFSVFNTLLLRPPPFRCRSN